MKRTVGFAYSVPAMLGLVWLAVVHAASAAQMAGPQDLPSLQLPPRVAEALLPPLHYELAPQGYGQASSRFDLVANDAPARQVFLSIASGSWYSMILHPAVTGNISVTLKHVSVPEALEAIREVYGYDYRLDGTRIFVQPAGPQTKMFQMNYLAGIRPGVRPESARHGEHVRHAADKDGVAPAMPTRAQGEFWTDLADSLRSLIGSGEDRNVMINSQSGIVVVRAMPAELRAVDDYLKALQRSVERQVILEAKIVEVTLNQASQSGINWNGLSGTGNVPNVVPPARRSDPGPAQAASAFANQDFASLLAFLESQGTVSVISSSRVATLNNQKAVVKMGFDQNYVSQIRAAVAHPEKGGQAGVNLLPTLASYFSGISLNIVPRIDEGGEILLHIHQCSLCLLPVRLFLLS